MNAMPLRDMSRNELKKELHEIAMSGFLLRAEEEDRSLSVKLGLLESELARRDTHRLTKSMVVAVVCNALLIAADIVLGLVLPN